VQLIGDQKVGSTISASGGRTFTDRATGNALGTSDVVEVISWLRDGKLVRTNATNPADRTYAITAADKGKVITARITASPVPGFGYLLPNVVSVSSQKIGTSLLPGADTPAPTLKALAESTDFATVLGFETAGGTGVTGLISPNSTANTVKYQWLRDGKAISKATKATYTLTAADNGHAISLRITTSHAAVGSTSYTTDVRYTNAKDWSITVDPGNEPYQSTNTWTLGSQGGLYGTHTFQSPDGLLTDPPIKIQWLRSGKEITGATGQTYVIQAADYNKVLSVRYTVGTAGYGVLVGTTAGQLVGKGITLGLADGYTDAEADVVPGSGVGTLKAVVSGLYPPTPAPTYSYVWLRNGVAIPKATAQTYKLVAADFGKDISVRITMKRTNFVVPTTVLPVSDPVSPTIYTDGTLPLISGTAAVGSTLTADGSPFFDDPGFSTLTTGISYVYTWYRSGTAISGAKSATYTPVAADLGKKITVAITATKAGRLAVTTPKSAATAAVVSGTIDPGSAVPQRSINLTTRKATVTLSDTPATTGTTTTYQWYRNGAKISGATAKTFVLATSDTDKSITVVVKLTRSGFTTHTYPALLVNGFTSGEPPAISGGTSATTADVGQELACVAPLYYKANGYQVNPDLVSTDRLDRQWTRDGVDVEGATDYHYVVPIQDSGHQISCTVTVGAKLHKTLVDDTTIPVTIS
jgi:hypothetical protein